MEQGKIVAIAAVTTRKVVGTKHFGSFLWYVPCHVVNFGFGRLVFFRT